MAAAAAGAAAAASVGLVTAAVAAAAAAAAAAASVGLVTAAVAAGRRCHRRLPPVVVGWWIYPMVAVGVVGRQAVTPFVFPRVGVLAVFAHDVVGCFAIVMGSVAGDDLAVDVVGVGHGGGVAVVSAGDVPLVHGVVVLWRVGIVGIVVNIVAVADADRNDDVNVGWIACADGFASENVDFGRSRVAVAKVFGIVLDPVSHELTGDAIGGRVRNVRVKRNGTYERWVTGGSAAGRCRGPGLDFRPECDGTEAKAIALATSVARMNDRVWVGGCMINLCW